MSDLDKLMAKMNENKKPAENKPIEKAPKVVETPTVEQIAKVGNPKETEIVDDDTDIEDVPQGDAVKEEVEQVPSKQEDHSIEQEVAVLQNNGIFRRELILTLKELVDVYKVNTQTLIEIKKKLLGEEDGGKKD